MNTEKETGKYVGKSKVLAIPIMVKVCEIIRANKTEVK